MCSSDQTAKPGTAIGTIKIENARTRVTEWRFRARGDNTGWHRHDYDYVVVPMFTGQLEILQADGSRVVSDLVAGEPYFRGLGVEHDVINANDFECAFVEIEFLETPRSA